MFNWVGQLGRGVEKLLIWNPHCFTWFGVPTYIHSTTFILTLLMLLQGVRALELTIFVVISVIIHEYGHILAARQFGIGCKKVLVLPIGGLAMLEAMPKEWKKELWIAAAGPLTSLVLAILGFVVAFPLIPFGIAKVPLDFCLVNLVLFLFNCLPIFPMDGGRVFRALLHAGLDYKQSTFIAVRGGQILGVVVALLLLLAGSLTGFITIGFIAFLAEIELKRTN